jgi:hypothetical protein
MRLTLALVVLSSLGGGCCCRRACCPPPVSAVVRAPQPAPAVVLPAGALEATLHYARGAAAARTHPAEARVAWNQALAALGKEPGPARLEAFRARIRARLAESLPAPAPGATANRPDVTVSVMEVSDLLEVMKRMPFPRVEIVGPDAVRPEEPLSLLGSVAVEQFPPAASGSKAPVLDAQGRTSLVVMASPEQQDALNDVINAWREAWPLLWPPATS